MRLGLNFFFALMLAVIGGSTGYAIAHYLRSFSAEYSLPVEPFVYRMAEAKVVSLGELRKFFSATQKNEEREFRLLETQLQNGPKVVNFESKPRLSKREWRDAPDWMLEKPADMQNGKFLDAVVRARASSAEDAVRLAQFSMEFFRYAVHVSVLREHLVQWGPVARKELAAISENLTKTASLLDGLARKIAAMQDLAVRSKGASQTPDPSPTGIQLQVDTLNVLSPAQQIVAFESERIQAISRDREDRLSADYLKLMISIADEFIPKLDAGQSPESVSAEILERVTQFAQTTVSTDQFAMERARATVDIAMTDLQARWLSARTEPEIPMVRPTGISRSIGLVAGAAIGIALWLLIVMRSHTKLSTKWLKPRWFPTLPTLLSEDSGRRSITTHANPERHLRQAP